VVTEQLGGWRLGVDVAPWAGEGGEEGGGCRRTGMTNPALSGHAVLGAEGQPLALDGFEHRGLPNGIWKESHVMRQRDTTQLARQGFG